MNFLAHLFLAREEAPGSMVGNLGADFIKGNQLAHLPPEVRSGIMLHRRVDAYTDSHPVVKESMYRLFPRWGRYSGILVDMVYDHFLAADWHRYTDEPLRQFLDGKYTVMREIAPTLPEELGQPLLGLIRSDRMMTYRELEGLRYALQWISKRFTRKVIHLDHAVEDFAELYAPLQEDFHRFFPELMQYFAETAAAERAASEEAET